jgi:PKD repeat protein
MKKHFALSLVAVIALFVLTLSTGCQKDSPTLGPAACITPIPSVVTIDTPLVFRSCSTGGTKYSWDFGDGQTADSSVAKHTYPNPGTYIIKLTVTNAGGSNTAIFTLQVNNPNGKVKKTVETTNGGPAVTTTYTFDTLGRVATILNNGNTTTYDYTGNILTMTTNGTPITGQLDIMGLLVNIGPITYTYDAAKYLILSNDGSQIISDTIVNGNTAVTVKTTATDTIITQYTFSSRIDYRDFGMSFLGTPNTNIINTKKVTHGPTVVTYNYTYTFDLYTRVTKQTITGSDGSSKVTTYTYLQ